MKHSNILKGLVAGAALSLTANSIANTIDFDSMTADITYLASDELAGRGNFTEQIDQAANYIAERYKSIGLKPLAGEKSFLQKFSLSQYTPEALDLTINGQAIAAENIAHISTVTSANFNKNSKIEISYIGEADNMRSALAELNQKGGHHLVIISPKFEGLFKRYQSFYSRGARQLVPVTEASITAVVSDISVVNEFNLTIKNKVENLTAQNVVGVLPSSAATKESILFSGHYDHLGIKLNQSDDKIFNGADDDASGTTAVIQLAEYYAKKQNNKRNLIFSAFTAEEIGGYGSKYFSLQLNPKNVVAMVNIEMIGKPSKFGAGAFWMTGFELSTLGKIMNQSLQKISEQQVHADPYPEQNLFYRSDNATLARLGVPAHSVSSTQLDKDQHYHQASDDLASLDLKSMHQVIENIALASENLVTGKATPTRVDTSQVTAKGVLY